MKNWNLDNLMKETDSDFALFAKSVIFVCSAFTGVIFILQGTHFVFNAIEDSVKYNRYKEAIKEYRDCAKPYKDSFDIDTYCGESPPPSMMI